MHNHFLIQSAIPCVIEFRRVKPSASAAYGSTFVNILPVTLAVGLATCSLDLHKWLTSQLHTGTRELDCDRQLRIR